MKRSAEAAEMTHTDLQERSRLLNVHMPCWTRSFRKELNHSTETLLRAWNGGEDVGHSSLPQERILQRTCVSLVWRGPHFL